MKLLFDQNISHRILSRLESVFPEAKHVRNFDLQFASDRTIWAFAKDNGYTIVTFDTDFCEFATLFGHPPKIVWLRFGNTHTNSLAEKLAVKVDTINAFLNDTTYSIIAILELND